MLEQSAASVLTLHDTHTKCMLYPDNLILLSPTEQRLQQSLSLVEQYCQRWVLIVNLEKTSIMIFQKKARSQWNQYQFTYSGTTLKHSSSYNYLGLEKS
jgi:hypothetical protein